MFIRYAPLMALLTLAAPSTVQAQNHDDHSHHTVPEAPAQTWQVSTHGVLTLVADNQEGPRGGEKTFIQGMAMVTAQRALGDRTRLTLEAMVSPDPFMGKNGYPLLLQAGETADGINHLVDRQHPHDLLMGLTTQLDHRFDNGLTATFEAGYPGEFAFGPTAFMHRRSGENFPTAPISHHWLDSGHITMGVVTAGLEKGSLELEVSQFTGREPDEQRFNLDPVSLDSTAIRATWRVTPYLSAQASWARQVSPEQLHPDETLIKQSVSLDYEKTFSASTLNTTLAWARKADEEGHDKPADAFVFENTLSLNRPWLILARYERVYHDELAAQAGWVAKTEVGVVRTFRLNATTTLGAGVVRQFNQVPESLEALYGGDPGGTIGFVTLKFQSGPDHGGTGMSH